MPQIPKEALIGGSIACTPEGCGLMGGTGIRNAINNQDLAKALSRTQIMYDAFLHEGKPIPQKMCSGVYGDEIRGMINNYDVLSAKQFVQELTLGVDPHGLQEPLIATGFKTWWVGPPSFKPSADRLIGAMRRNETSPVAMIKFEQLGGGANLASSLGEFGADTLAKIPGVGEVMGLLKIAVSIPVIGDLIGLIASVVESIGQFAADIVCAATLGLFCL